MRRVSWVLLGSSLACSGGISSSPPAQLTPVDTVTARPEAIVEPASPPPALVPDTILAPEMAPQVPDTVGWLSETSFWEEEVLPDATADAGPSWDVDVESHQFDERVLYYVDYFQGPARERFDIWLDRMPRYEEMIRAAFRGKGLPEDLVYLGIVESGYSNTAVSCAGAVGMWQFMYSTAKLYDLEVNQWVDERRDPVRATQAAAAYLADLTSEFGSPYLAAAAYNGGPGRVRRGIARLASRSSGPSDDTFFELASSRRHLRRETRDYVPKFIAAALIAKEPERYGFEIDSEAESWQYDEILIPDATGLDVLAELADTSVAALIVLNPQFVRGITPPRREVRVRVPAGRGTQVTERYADLPVSTRVNSVEHRIRRGETLGGLSKRYKVPLKAIRAANPGVRPTRLRIRQRILIPTSGTIVPAAAWADGSGRPRYPRRCGRSYRVKRGDTMGHIAQRFRVSLTVLLRANRMRSTDMLRAGAVIRVPAR